MPRSKRNKPSSAASAKASSSLRIIGGQHRGRKLPIPELDGLRPTSDRVRETLFNWIQFEVPGATVLDLFSGTGALGLEALSREAKQATFIEPQAAAARALSQSIKTLDLQNADVMNTTAERFLAGTPQPFDIVFVDPPFSLNLWEKTLQDLVEKQWLASEALLYLECPVDQNVTLPEALTVIKEKKAGKVLYRLLQFGG